MILAYFPGAVIVVLDKADKARKTMEAKHDRRANKRLVMKVTVLCQTVGQVAGRTCTGHTVNVSPGGALVEMQDHNLKVGQLISVDMSVPPAEDLLDLGGRFSSYARIVRIQSHSAPEPTEFASSTQRIAFEFCQSLKMRT